MSDTTTERPIITRAEAKAQGLPRYFTGKACVNGHVSERNTNDWNCVACRAEKDAKRVASGEMAARNRRYYAADPDRTAARLGWRIAAARGAVLPAEFPDVTAQIDATKHFYAEARRLTATTGTAYQVDHILPIERGGQHRPNNLRTVPASFNLRKRTSTDCEVLERIDAGRWTGDVALAVAIASQHCPNHQPGQLALPF